MPSSQSFSMIHRRISDSAPPAAPENSGEPENTIASRVPPSMMSGVAGSSATGFILLIMCIRNSSDPSETRGRPGP